MGSVYYWLARVWFSDIIVLLAGSPWEIPIWMILSLKPGAKYTSPGAVEAVGLFPEGDQLLGPATKVDHPKP